MISTMHKPTVRETSNLRCVSIMRCFYSNPCDQLVNNKALSHSQLRDVAKPSLIIACSVLGTATIARARTVFPLTNLIASKDGSSAIEFLSRAYFAMWFIMGSAEWDFTDLRMSEKVCYERRGIISFVDADNVVLRPVVLDWMVE